jgi:hypothetical protein
VNDLEEQLSRLRVKNENSSIDRLRGEVTFESLVNSYSVHISVVNEPDDLVREQLGVVLRVQIRLSRFAGV